VGAGCTHVGEGRRADSRAGPNILLFISNRTGCILLVAPTSVRGGVLIRAPPPPPPSLPSRDRQTLCSDGAGRSSRSSYRSSRTAAMWQQMRCHQGFDFGGKGVAAPAVQILCMAAN
jgi:hypothetical protein